MHIPPEITDNIIDFLHDDHESLRSCRLVCREWVPSARFHLFYTFDNCTRSYQAKFEDLLESAPQIAHHIRHVRLFVRFQPIELCSSFYNVTTLALLWCRIVDLKRLVQLLGSLPGLINLRLKSCRLPGTAYTENVAFDNPPKSIQVLHLIDNPEMDMTRFVDWSVAVNLFPQIHTLHYSDAWMGRLPALTRLFTSFGANLMHVRFGNLPTAHQEEFFDALASLANLRTLEINQLQFNWHGEGEMSWNIFHIPRFFSRLTSRSITQISMEICLQYDNSSGWGDLKEQEYDEALTNIWREVARTLQDDYRFGRLGMVRLLVDKDSRHKEAPYFVPLFALRERGVVDLSWSHTN